MTAFLRRSGGSLKPNLPVIALLLTALCWMPAQAQPPRAPSAYPTLAALESTTVPLADPVELARRLRGLQTVPPTPSAPPSPQIGDRQTFWVLNSGENREFQVSAALRMMGQHLLLWVQDTLPDGTPITPLNDADLRALADAFDTAIYPQVRDLWGSEASPGVDGDPRIYGLFAYGLGPGVAAYFASRHTYPAVVQPTSNQHEMFLFNLDTIQPEAVASPLVQSVVAHEFQHMIRANLQANDAIWLNEGFSTFTQLYLYDDPGAALSFLSAPGTQLNTWSEDGPRTPHYGASLLFVTYVYERYGLDALRAISADSGVGLDTFERILRGLGQPGVNDLFADWTLANFLLDPTLADGRYGYRLLPDGLPGAAPRATITAYPYLAAGVTSQYSADYTVLTNLDGLTALDISLAAPETVKLLPVDAAGGQWMWYSNRGDMSDTTLTRAFDLSGVSRATLNYRVWYHLEESWDYAYVMVSEDGGATWDILSTPHTTEANPHSAAYGPGYSGASGGWLDESLPLDAYAGRPILVRFEMITDDAINQPGLALDEVSIPEIGYSSGFESDDGGWLAEGWLRIDNRLPQRAWVQAIRHSGREAAFMRWMTPQESSWMLPLAEGVNQVTLVIAPFAPTTTVPMPYTLSVTAR
ncbi:MAG: immune inhibitor A [Chloroflexi bacterium]|nr:immune inhibitor A [Chloroflexota bacterium]